MEEVRAVRRDSCSSISARSPIASESGNSSITSRPKRIASSARSARVSDLPDEAAYPSFEARCPIDRANQFSTALDKECVRRGSSPWPARSAVLCCKERANFDRGFSRHRVGAAFDPSDGFVSVNGPSITLRFVPENVTRAPFELGCSPSAALTNHDFHREISFCLWLLSWAKVRSRKRLETFLDRRGQSNGRAQSAICPVSAGTHR